MRLKKEAISFGVLIKSKPGTYVEARDWNALINSHDVLILDIRNEGGILKLEEIPEGQSQWEGECYVFDDRVALRHGLVPSTTFENGTIMTKKCSGTKK